MAGITYDGISSTQKLVSEVSGTQGSHTTGSFSDIRVATLVATGQVTGGASIGSPTTNGAFVQAGIVGPLANGSGIITFGRSFADTSYAITVTALGSLATLPYVFSGTTLHTTSGTIFGGQSGTNAIYGYIAVGL